MLKAFYILARIKEWKKRRFISQQGAMMKKILCYFLLLIFPSFIFSQDASLLTGNFSLVKHSRNKKPYYFIPNMALSVNNLFQAEEKYHSDQYMLFQIHGFQQSSEQPSFLEDLAFKNQNQKWTWTYNPNYGQVQDIASEEKLESLAEGYLERLAEKKKKSRKTWGATGLIGGIIAGFGATLGALIGISVGIDEKIQFEGLTDLEIQKTLNKLRKKARVRDCK